MCDVEVTFTKGCFVELVRLCFLKAIKIGLVLCPQMNGQVVNVICGAVHNYFRNCGYQI